MWSKRWFALRLGHVEAIEKEKGKGQYPEVRIEDIRVLRKKKAHPQD
ncbi:MAG: hypothetical protein Ct9H90mP24_6500 [Methanobacteriota archaeon]|nr:MAG: hypothetical protein Ct9H90mP24_6500 [Euryarchaeota archaeon]